MADHEHDWERKQRTEPGPPEFDARGDEIYPRRRRVAETWIECSICDVHLDSMIVTDVAGLAAAMHDADVGCGDDGRNLHYQDGEADPIALHMEDAAAIAAALKEDKPKKEPLDEDWSTKGRQRP